jgi:hypothetical protein
LDQLVEQFINKIVIEKYRRPEFRKLVAIREFRSRDHFGSHRRGVYLAEKTAAAGLRPARKILKRFARCASYIAARPRGVVPGL